MKLRIYCEMKSVHIICIILQCIRCSWVKYRWVGVRGESFSEYRSVLLSRCHIQGTHCFSFCSDILWFFLWVRDPPTVSFQGGRARTARELFPNALHIITALPSLPPHPCIHIMSNFSLFPFFFLITIDFLLYYINLYLS